MDSESRDAVCLDLGGKFLSSFTTQQLTDLEAAIAQGALIVKYSDKTVQYRDLTEMMRVRDLMRKELGIVSPQNLRILPSFSKGEPKC